MLISIRTDNAAFEGQNRAIEVSRILREVANKFEDGRWEVGDRRSLLDINGNKVGTVRGK